MFPETRTMLTVPLEYDDYEVLDLEEAEQTMLHCDFLTAGLTTSIQVVADETSEEPISPAREAINKLRYLLELELMRPSSMPSDNKENVDPDRDAVFLR